MNSFAQIKQDTQGRASVNAYRERARDDFTTSQFVDDRPGAVVQKQLHETLNQSSTVVSQLQLQQSLNRGPRFAEQAKLANFLSVGRDSTQPAIQRQEVPGRSAQRRLDTAATSGAATLVVQGKFIAVGNEGWFVDMDTRDGYKLVRRTDSYLILRRDSDQHEVRVDARTMEPIENEHQRGFRLGKAPDPLAPQSPVPNLEGPYETPSVATLYKRMFPNGVTFQDKSLQEVAEDNQVVELREQAKMVEQLKALARSGNREARDALSERGPELARLGEALAKRLFGRVENYKDFLFLMDQFLAGKLATNPVYTGTLWSETSDLIGQLREITHYGITTWESQPSNQEHEIEGHKGVKERQFAFLELSGPAALIGGLIEQLAPFRNITIIHPGETRVVPMKQLRARSLEQLQAITGESSQFTEPEKKGSIYQVNWLDQISNNAKYIGRAVENVPSLGAVIGSHTYLYLVSKDIENATGLFDTVLAILPRVKPVTRYGDVGQGDDGEHEAETEHLESYSTTAFSGNVGD